MCVLVLVCVCTLSLVLAVAGLAQFLLGLQLVQQNLVLLQDQGSLLLETTPLGTRAYTDTHV